MNGNAFPKIGLALSGGGFRASLFHLGVIRRLEELGLMRYISVVSSVSGGSIIAAYYLVEMERRLRQKAVRGDDIAGRVEIWNEIAHDFIQALDHNLRSRAILFTPRYHPWLFVKTLVLKAVRANARSELIQAEYDKWFYHENTLDQLPSVIPNGGHDAYNPLTGPKLVLNTTSLLTGERKTFSRVPKTAINDLRTPDTNLILLSKVVGASSCVPVLFPPTTIRGDVLVDGGVADNQGIEALIEESCEVLLVSDASGQMSVADSLGAGEAEVYLRVNSIFQLQIRRKLLDGLKERRALGHEVGFIHLLQNLKDVEAQRGRHVPRVSSELIPGIARIRTDLDQFSPIERELLMYHGYTLIDAEIEGCCPNLRQLCEPAPMRVAPLFAQDWTDEHRRLIRVDVEAGRCGTFLQRTWTKHPWLIAPAYAMGVLGWLAATVLLFAAGKPLAYTSDWVYRTINAILPSFVASLIDRLLAYLNLPNVEAILRGVASTAGFLIVTAIPLYVMLFVLFSVARKVGGARDLAIYRQIAGGPPRTDWNIGDSSNARAAAANALE